MPGDSKECRQNAARCLELAASTANDAIKQTFLNLAKHWEALAQELERAKSILGDERGAIPMKSKRKRKRRKSVAAMAPKPKKKRSSSSVRPKNQTVKRVGGSGNASLTNSIR